ncbi:sugar transferase [Flavobacterium akiainvivens]|uniref:Sugar transferase n=1 Tax=Flavobacterium akiainvivens TaxID=1202724 RepID=A0A0M9VIF5_9FLAO|nr:sugar transferase [Flavobacterium akiainvivens]KOS06359.1 sugar transferase [Flavobacterium akiainvivens]SFQ15263.1 Sugar transferase involved in LPS biosynthesis (colanic, teichoic acid) [Flavobacterium akiainvivens]
MLKRGFDIFFALTGLLLAGWAIVLFFLLATLDTRKNGIFKQKRIGQYGRPFIIYKLRSIASVSPEGKWTITRLGRFMRDYKIDELPQFINILKGDMSAVGPRPDIPGYYDTLVGDDRLVLQLKPGLTGPSNLKYWNEEYDLAAQPNPLRYNDEVLFPDKVRINLCYFKKQSFWLDLKIIFYTITGKRFADDAFYC